MTVAFARVFRTTAATSAVALLLAAGAAHSTGTRQIEGPPGLTQTSAEEEFPDAPYGVDPMVTGPTTASFRLKQSNAGCDAAVWPNIPLACYPG